MLWPTIVIIVVGTESAGRGGCSVFIVWPGGQSLFYLEYEMPLQGIGGTIIIITNIP